MGLYVALLRGINVGGHAKVAMADLRDLLSELGLANPRTLLQTGNLVFEAEGTTPAALERLLEQQAAERLALRTDFLIRTADDVARVLAGNPFPEQAQRDPSHLVVMFLRTAPAPAAVDALRAAVKGRETIHAVGTHAYLTYPDGIGRSRLTNTLVESKLGTRGTARNWNTVLKLAALLCA